MRQRPGWFCLGDDPKIRGEGVGTARRGRRDNRRAAEDLRRDPLLCPCSFHHAMEQRGRQRKTGYGEASARQCVADEPEIGPSM